MATNSNLESMLKAISQKRQELEGELAPGGQLEGFDGLTSDQKFVKNLDPQVCDLYRGVAKVMARFRSGQPPKAFKIIPTLANWEQILELTEPNNWTAASVYEATKLFASNLKNDMAQKFYNIILLPRLRDDLQEFKKLNFHMYNALKRSLYKPAAFYKGIILPLCEDSSEASLREAVAISSILKKVHVPVLHSAAALLKIAEMPHSPVRCVFMMDLISKNYALPYRVLDALVDHFTRYTYDDSFEPNVQWHQTLLKFCQLYTRDISSEQREALLELIKHRTHQQISPEVRKILQKTKPRDVELSNGDRMELEDGDNDKDNVDDEDNSDDEDNDFDEDEDEDDEDFDEEDEESDTMDD